MELPIHYGIMLNNQRKVDTYGHKIYTLEYRVQLN